MSDERRAGRCRGTDKEGVSLFERSRDSRTDALRSSGIGPRSRLDELFTLGQLIRHGCVVTCGFFVQIYKEEDDYEYAEQNL